MKKNILVVASLFIVLQLVGCASNVATAPAPVIDRTDPTPKPDVVQPEKPVEVPAIPPAVPQTRAPVPSASSNAIGSLAVQARGQYTAKNYQAAIATAERGLRIDRRSPELYLILAQSYVQLANTQLAQQFVQQGIRYAQAGTEVAQSLVSIRDSLAK